MTNHDPDPQELDSTSLSRYITDRLKANNYAEARRATAMLLVRLAPEPGANPLARAPIVERVADAIIESHMAGQVIGEARYERPLRELLEVCIAMDAEADAERPDESEYQRVVVQAARALDMEVPTALLEAWGRGVGR